MDIKKLSYDRYGCSDNIITIDLHNDYILRADKMWDHQNNHYVVEYMIREKTVERWQPVRTKEEKIIFKADYRTINSAILKDVSTRLVEGLFDSDINVYKYEMYCFEKGNEIVEQERLKLSAKEVLAS